MKHAPKKPGETVRCVDCGQLMVVQKSSVQQYEYWGDGVRCKRRPACRSRLLDPILAKAAGLTEDQRLLFAKDARQRLRARMDARPANAVKGQWGSPRLVIERVMDAVIYFSWCWPVCLPYACEIADNDQDVAMGRDGQPKKLTREKLGAFLGIAQPHMSEACKQLVRRKDLRIDEEGRLAPVADPAITDLERTEILSRQARDSYAIPPVWGRRAEERIEVLRELGDDTDDQLVAGVVEDMLNIRRKFLDSVKEGRKDEIAGYKADIAKLDERIAARRAAGAVPDPARRSPVSPEPTRRAPARPVPIDRGGTPEVILFRELARIQELYPGTTFGSEIVDPGNSGDRQTIEAMAKMLKEKRIEGYSPAQVAVEFIEYVENQFAGVDALGTAPRPPRSPLHEHGPRKVSLLLEWCADFVRNIHALIPAQRAYRESLAAEAQRAADTDRAIDEQQAAEARMAEAVDRAREELPPAEVEARHAAIRQQLKTSIPTWGSLTPEQQADRIETQLRRELRGEITAASGGSL